jgi:hypothetical protein
MALLLFVRDRGQGELPQMVLALYFPSRFAGGLDGGQEEGDEDADDGDHDEELDKRETVWVPLNESLRLLATVD